MAVKLSAIQEFEKTGNKKATTRKFKISPYQLMQWLKKKEKIQELARDSSRKLTLHTGRKPHYPDLEETVYDWIMDQRFAEMAVTPMDIIDKANALLPNFKNGDEKKQIYWVYNYLQRHNLSIRTKTRVSQILDAAMQPVKQQFCREIMTSFHQNISDPKYLINMDETAVYLNCTPKRTVHPRGERTVAVRIGGSSSIRFTLAVTVAMDGSKLPLFVIFKGKTGGHIEKKLPDILPDGVFGCVQRKAWMDNRTMSIWYDTVYKPYIAEYGGKSGLLLDDFKCHKSTELGNSMDAGNAIRFMIPPHYTGLLQPCDVGINKSLKDRLKRSASNWRRARHAELPPGERLPFPKRKDILSWLKSIWEEFPVEIVKNSFTGSGYYFEDGIDYSGEAESDSDSD